ncbi:hypothetical protein WAI453_002404 [Rhynchosporium graminicola]
MSPIKQLSKSFKNRHRSCAFQLLYFTQSSAELVIMLSRHFILFRDLVMAVSGHAIFTTHQSSSADLMATANSGHMLRGYVVVELCPLLTRSVKFTMIQMVDSILMYALTIDIPISAYFSDSGLENGRGGIGIRAGDGRLKARDQSRIDKFNSKQETFVAGTIEPIIYIYMMKLFAEPFPEYSALPSSQTPILVIFVSSHHS